MEKFSPDREGFEAQQEQHKIEKEKLIEETRVVALVEDILRNSTREEYKNLKEDFIMGERGGRLGTIFTGKIGGHEISLSEKFAGVDARRVPFSDYVLMIDGVKFMEGIYGNRGVYTRLEDLLENIKKERVEV